MGNHDITVTCPNCGTYIDYRTTDICQECGRVYNWKVDRPKELAEMKQKRMNTQNK